MVVPGETSLVVQVVYHLPEEVVELLLKEVAYNVKQLVGVHCVQQKTLMHHVVVVGYYV